MYKFVEPDTKVVALKVEKLEAPDAVIEFNEGEATRLIVGLTAVPPVVIFVPALTLFTTRLD